MSARERTAREGAVLDEVAAAVAPLHLEVEDVTVTPAGKRRLVRILLDRDLTDLPEGDHDSVVPPLSLDFVAEATRAVSDALDSSDLMGEQPYVLEVSSPGTDRPLTTPRHFRRNVGRLIQVKRAEEEPITARLVAADGDGITLEDESTQHTIAYAQVIQGTVQLEFNRADDEI